MFLSTEIGAGHTDVSSQTSRHHSPLSLQDNSLQLLGCREQSNLSSVPSATIMRFVLSLLSDAGKLSPKNREVLELLLLGRRYSEIAEILGKSPNTIATQVKKILQSLGADSARDLFRVFLIELDIATQSE